MKLFDLFPVKVNESMPPGTLMFVQNGKPVLTVVGIVVELQVDTITLDGVTAKNGLQPVPASDSITTEQE